MRQSPRPKRLRSFGQFTRSCLAKGSQTIKLNVLSRLSSATFEDALDWLCLNLPGNELPLKFSSGASLHVNGGGSIGIISTAKENWIPSTDSSAEVGDEIHQVAIRTKGRRDDDTLDAFQSSQADWIRQYVEQQEEDELETWEADAIENNFRKQVPESRRDFDSLIEEYHAARLEALNAKERKDKKAQEQSGQIIRKIKQELSALGVSDEVLASGYETYLQTTTEDPHGGSMSSNDHVAVSTSNVACDTDSVVHDLEPEVDGHVKESHKSNELLSEENSTSIPDCDKTSLEEEGLGDVELGNFLFEDASAGEVLPPEVVSLQKAGVHFRLRARTFIVAEPHGNRIVFVNLDACMASQLVTIKVLERLKARYGNLYTDQNVAISGIHTHAGPGGYLQYVVYIVTSLGFVRQSFDALVDGIEQSIIQAHESLRPGSVFVNKGEILDAGVNRSPSAYLNNPAAERSKYKYDVDKEMTLLKFVDDVWGPVGSFNWFATHGTSMSRTNALISGDNKGAAARFMEDWFDKNGGGTRSTYVSEAIKNPRRVSDIIPVVRENHHQLLEIAASFKSSSGKPATKFLSIARRVRSALRQADRPRFVSAFCQTNCGDVSPNVLGAFCTDTGLPCDFNHSTCGGKNELCYGRGPAYPDEFESTRIIGERQFRKAVDLFNKASEQLKGKVDYRHAYLDFSKLEVTIPKQGGGSEVVKTCPAAMGFAFAAGTTDGPGAFDFKQGDDKGNPFWRLVRNLLKTPGKEQNDCQHPKPILLDTGEMKQPYDWAPSVLPIQILRIGQLVILSVPGEFTTMAGRRLRDAVKALLISGGGGQFNASTHVVIAGLTNTYSQYVTTFEEYAMQRYEGASTLYGPHALSAYIQEFKRLTTSLLAGKPVEPGPTPPDLLDEQISLLPPVVVDMTPLGVNFGDVSTDVPQNSTFRRGSDTVSVVFWSACPRNDLMTEGTFALVEALQGKDTWVPVYDDDDFCLRFKWSRPAKLSARSHATIEWRIPQSTMPGVYRIRHFGAAKSLLGSIRHFTGSSSAFVVA